MILVDRKKRGGALQSDDPAVISEVDKIMKMIIILYIKKKRETERACARQRWYDAGCQGGGGVRVGGCTRAYRNRVVK